MNSFQKNLDFKSFNNLLHSIKSNNIIVTNCDKNVGIALVQHNVYNKLCFNHLNDIITYKKIDFNPQFFLINECKFILSNLFTYNHISVKIYRKLLNNINYKKIPSFRILPKLHKDKFGIRPLVNCSNTILSILSIFIDFYLKPLVQKHFSYLKDSQHLIQLLLNKSFDSKAKLHTADFESLYTNIPLDEAISIISDLFKRTFDFTDVSAYAFHSILKLTLKSNYFYFKSDFNFYFYLQIKGVAMGTQCGPSIANLYLAFYEIRFHSLLNFTIYHRYIDDLFFIADELIVDNYFKYIFPGLNLNIDQSDKVNFLDLNISFHFDYSLYIDLFIKPTHTFSYLNFNSNHPPFIFKNIPNSLIQRARKICTFDHDYLFHCSKIHTHLLNRGYSSKLILHLIRHYLSIDRMSLIPYKIKTNKFSNVIPFFNYFDRFLPNINSLITELFQNNFNINSNFNFKIFYKIFPNFNSYFVNNFNPPIKFAKYKKCFNINCFICAYANCSSNLSNKFNLPISIPCYSTCSSKNVIYIIRCTKCNEFYIGETSRSIGTRIKEHINNIKKCINNFNLNDSNFNNFVLKFQHSSYLYKHFASNHSISEHFSFQCFVSNFILYRLRLETDLILLFDNIYPRGLNSIKSTKIFSLESYMHPPLLNFKV